MRWVIARVLPVPAPASTTTGPDTAVAAARCSGSSPASTASGSPGCGRAAHRSILAHRLRQRPGTGGRAGPGGVSTATEQRGRAGRCHRWNDRPRRREAKDATVSVTMYSTPWCGYCSRLKAQMTREGIAWTEVDIEQDPEAAELVMQVNGGNQTVPTLVFPDGSAATNPSIGEVKRLLAAAS